MRLHTLSFSAARSWALLTTPLAMTACVSEWTAVDGDGDGITLAQGDCDDGPDGADIYPGAAEIWYDGIDSDCEGDNDFDQDGDGYDAVGYTGDSGEPGDDCWDDPTATPATYAAAPDQVQLAAADVHPDATDIYYDGIDANCDGSADFDQDGDGYDSDLWPRQDATYGDDCYDVMDENCVNYDETDVDCTYPVSGPLQGEAIDPSDIHPDATDTWYDGTDQDCGGENDFDQDGDGFESYAECNDLDPDIFPNPEIPEVWYNGNDENCDGNDADQDGDTYLDADYAGGYDHDAAYYSPGDCWDDIEEASEWLPYNDFPALTPAEVHPEAEDEWYDGLDANCEENSDFDQDYDGYDTDAWLNQDGLYGDDCDDEAGDTNPGAIDTWYDGEDSDCAENNDYDQDYDGYGQDGSGLGEDCDDVRDAVNPAAIETCETTYDDDCDGSTNDSYADFCTIYYSDEDGDAHGGPNFDCLCEIDATYIYEDYTDCDDTRSTVYPDADEVVGNQRDEDCDGQEICYHDDDDDTYLDDTEDTIVSIDADCIDANEGTEDDLTSDCDDTDSGDYPGASEIIGNEDDEDCDGGEICYNDDDNDNYLDTSGDTIVSSNVACTDDYEGTNTDITTDCDDADAGDYPGATETVGNQDDEDCDGGEICLHDDDDDGYLDTTADTIESAVDADCEDEYEGSDATPTTDCDDTDAGDNPEATETPGNEDDEDCNGGEICYHDDDNDNYLDTSGDTVESSNVACTDANEGTWTDATTDCDDTDGGDYPGAAETVGNQDDEDCDGGEICFHDDDNDNYLDTTLDTISSSNVACTDANEGSLTDPTTDCDDADSGDHPGADEVTGNQDDEDCDGQEICFEDDDNDNYLDTTGDTRLSDTNTVCTDAYEGSSTDPTTDCDDADPADYPGASETVGNQDDEDCDGGEICYDDDDDDGFLDATGDTRVSSNTSCDDTNEGSTSTLTTDCDDASNSDYPGADEIVGNQDDEDCDLGEICFHDDDNDGYLDTSADTIESTNVTCTDANEGSTSDLTTDCDDASNTDYPGATEIVGNQDDEDCDNGEICFHDDDNDGYLDTAADTVVSSNVTCTDANEGSTSDLTTDCDDASNTDYPGATEIVGNEDDESCDGGETCYHDDDNDGYLDTSGDTVASTNVTCTDANEGSASDLTTDCNDASGSIYPGATETCNDTDDDCDSSTDEGLTLYYTDTDGDGQGAGAGDCSTSGVTTNTDCDESDKYVYAGAPEICDNQYNNCSTSGSWSTSSEVGEVSILNGTTWTDITSTFSGTSGTPGTRTLSNNDTMYFCGTATVYGRVSATSVDATITSLHGSPTWDGGSSSGSALSVSGGHVSVSNLTMAHGSGTSTYGGTIYATASTAPSASTYTVALSSVTVKQGSTSYGGGIAADEYASIKLTSSVVTDNTASQNGGGVWLDTNARLETATAATFSLNDAGVNGGGIYVTGTGSTTAVSAAGTIAFTSNTAGGNGGGVYQAGGLFTMGPATFTTNTAATNGGGFYFAAGTANITGTASSALTFTSNIATSGSGGALYIANGTWTSYYNSLLGNSAGGDGGAVGIAVGNGIFSSTSTVTDNVSDDDGGAFYVGSGALIVGSGMTLSENMAAGIGGALAVRGGTASFTSPAFTDNWSESASGGGAIGITNGAVTLTTPTLTNNDATAGDGGGIWLDGTGSVSVAGGSMTGNSAAGDGGNAYIDNTATFSSSGGGTVISGGDAGGDGGNLYIKSGTVGITSATVTTGVATKGGGLFIDGGTVTLTSASVTNNDADDDGGGLYLNGGTLSTTSLTLTGNTAVDKGGGGWLGATTTWTTPNVSSNAALGAGGGLFVDAGTATLSTLTMHDNDADEGGGMYLDTGTTASLSSPMIYDNTATNGGGLFLVGALSMSCGTGTFGIYANDATTDGGGVYMSGSPTISSTLCDWGVALGTFDNYAGAVSSDIELTNNTNVSKDDNATFTCTGTACTP